MNRIAYIEIAVVVLLLGAICRLATIRGEVTIEVDAPQIQVPITHDGRQVKILKKGDCHDTILRNGKYRIDVRESGDSSKSN